MIIHCFIDITLENSTKQMLLVINILKLQINGDKISCMH